MLRGNRSGSPPILSPGSLKQHFGGVCRQDSGALQGLSRKRWSGVKKSNSISIYLEIYQSTYVCYRGDRRDYRSPHQVDGQAAIATAQACHSLQSRARCLGSPPHPPSFTFLQFGGPRFIVSPKDRLEQLHRRISGTLSADVTNVVHSFSLCSLWLSQVRPSERPKCISYTGDLCLEVIDAYRSRSSHS